MSLTREVLILVFTISGISLKLADIYGEKGGGYVLAAVSAASMGILISDGSLSSSIILGIILGVTLAGKIDQNNLRIGLGLTIVIAAILELLSSFNIPNLPLLAIVAAAALIDEVGHDRFTSGRILAKFFRFRMTLKTVILVLAIQHQSILVYAIGFFSFDIAYDVTDFVWLFYAKNKK